VTRPDLYHPTFAYELIWNLGVAAMVWLLDRKFKFGRGRAFALYVMGYTAGRLWIEMLRVDEATTFFGVRLNVFTSIIIFLGAAVYFAVVRGPRGYVVPIDAPDTAPAPSADGESDVSQVDVTAASKGDARKIPVAYRVVSEAQFHEYQETGILPAADRADEKTDDEAGEKPAAKTGDESVSATVGDTDNKDES
jgi:hypothetical protein